MRFTRTLLVLALLFGGLAEAASAEQQYIITTIAGTGESGHGGFSGDGGPASLAQLNSPRGVAVDGAGNLYIADSLNNRINKVDSAGTLTLFAYCCVAKGVAVDGDGNVYIADSGSGRIRKVDPSSRSITTFAGGGEFSASLGDGGPASQARLSRRVSGVAVAGDGNVYIADRDNARIRRVDPSGTITTFAGTGSCPRRQCHGFNGDGGPASQAQLFAPEGVAVDGDGNVYIADSGNGRIRKVDATTGTITTIAGSGECCSLGADGDPVSQAWLYRPVGVAVDGDGNVYIAVRGNHLIRKLTPVGPAAPQIYYFPHLAVGAGWQTTITYINYSPEEVTCQTEFPLR